MAARPFRKDPISVSFTGWKRYNECPEQHYLVMTGQRPDKPNERNVLNGQILHTILERWFLNDEPASWIATQADPVWREYTEKLYILFKSEGDRNELYERCVKWCASLAAQVEQLGFDKARCLTEQKLERELIVDGHRVVLKGYLDVMAPTLANEWLIMDLKASTNRKVMNPYQMVFYSLLLQDDLHPDQPVRDSAFILPALDDIVPFQVGQEHRDWLLADIEKMARGIIADQFAPDDKSGACWFCDVKALCSIKGAPSGTGRIML